MAVTLTGTGGFFTRLGVIETEVRRALTAVGSSLNTGVSNIAAQFLSNEQLQADGLYNQRDAARLTPTTYLTYLQSLAQNYAIEQVHRDVTLSSKTLYNALKELIRQMISSSSSLNRPTIAATVTAASTNFGNTVLAASTTDQFGQPLDMQFAETITVKCTADSTNGGATKWQEPLQVSGQVAKGVFEYDWPGGSGASGTFNVTDAAQTTEITDGSFETWAGTPLTPTYWTIVTGTAGTHVVRSTNFVRGSYALRFASDGSTLVKVKQALSLDPQKQYCLNCWADMSSLDANGVVRFRLEDGSGSVINDDAGTANSYTRNTNGQLTTSYGQVNTFFRTPSQMPDNVYLVIEFTTSPANGITVDFDLLALVEAKQTYAGGCFIAAFSKDDWTTKDDYYSIACTNSLGTESFVRTVDRLYSLRSLGLAFRSSGSPTVNDNLIS